MGNEIERLALDRGWTVDICLDIDTPPPKPEAMRKVDVAIHFASAQSIVDNLMSWVEVGKPVVVGTTGWKKDLPRITQLVQEKGTGLVHASNFSLGVNIFNQLARTAARLFNHFVEYDAFIQEIHHKDKLDSPSGTALTLAEIVLHELHHKTEIFHQLPEGKILSHQLHVSSARGGAVVGTHALTFDSAADAIELRHTAKNRSGFALGALLAAEWIQGKQGIYTMEDVIRDLLITK